MSNSLPGTAGFSSPEAAPSAPAALGFPATDAQIHEFPNGLELITKVDRSAPVASVQAWVRTGSIHESQHLGAGISHLVEHLVFKGTTKRSSDEIAQHIQDGGGYLNAYTSFDRTVYWVDTPAAGAETALDVIAGLVTDAQFPEDEYEREKDVIRREIDMGKDDPGRASSQLALKTVFREHPFREPVIGHRELFDTITRDEAFSYYKTRYAPNNVFFVVTGDIDPEAIRAQLETLFSEIPRGPLVPPPIAAEPAQLGCREATRTFPTGLSKFHLAWRVPGLTHPDVPALDVLAGILGDGRSSRLYRPLREEQSLVHGIGASAYTPGTEGVFFVSADCDPEKRTEAISAALEIIRDVSENGVTQAEVDKIRRGLLADEFDSLTTTRGLAATLGSDYLYTGDLDFTRHALAALSEVTPAAVQAAAAKYLDPKKITQASLIPPPAETAGSSSVSAPSIGTKTADPVLTTLPNGLRLLVQEDRRVPLFDCFATFLGGSLSEGAAGTRSGLTALTANVLTKGTTTRSAAEISDLIEGLGGRIGSNAGNNSFSLSAGTMSPDFATTADLFADVLLRPAFAEPEIARERDAMLAALTREEDHPLRIAMRQMRKSLFGDHPYGTPPSGTEASIPGLTPSGITDFYSAHATGQNGVVTVYGAVDPAEVADRLGTALATLPSGTKTDPTASQADETSFPAPSTTTLERDKEQAVLVVGFRTPGLFGSDRLALDLIEESCSDMASRLFARIREELGLAYYVSCGQMHGLEAGMFQFYLGTSPEQLDLAQSELLAQIQQLAQGDLQETEFTRAAATHLGKLQLGLQSSAARARHAALDELYGYGHRHTAELPTRVAALTLEDARTAAARIFSTEPTIVRVLRS